ncbi:VWA domain-containing protein [soil metagenome]
MIFDPLFELPVILWLLVPPALLLGWQLFRTRKLGGGRAAWRQRWQPIRRIVVLLLLAFAAIGPAVPGALTKVVVSDIDVFLVIDTTTSSNAEDYGVDGGTRLDAIKADALRVAEAYGGARYSIITFDNGSLVRLPLVADPTALKTALSTLDVEVTDYSAGSSISEAKDTLLKRLKASQSEHPDRLRLVFYFGDGEQTRDDAPESFAESKQYVSDGAVFGYGTATGGPMRSNQFVDYTFGQQTDSGDDVDAPYVLDTTKPGSPKAISKIDEGNLNVIANQLGVGYQHVTPADPANYPDVADQIGEEIEVPEVAVAARYYWVPMIAVFLLLLWDLVISARQIGELRAARPKKTGRSGGGSSDAALPAPTRGRGR